MLSLSLFALVTNLYR